MESVPVTTIGSLVIIHRDNPSDTTVRNRVHALLNGTRRLPQKGIIEAWPGENPDEFHWKTVIGSFCPAA
jgi:hypothetical protein